METKVITLPRPQKDLSWMTLRLELEDLVPGIVYNTRGDKIDFIVPEDVKAGQIQGVLDRHVAVDETPLIAAKVEAARNAEISALPIMRDIVDRLVALEEALK